MSENKNTIKTWLTITNSDVVAKINDLKNENGITYPAAINQLLFKAYKYDENTSANESFNAKLLNDFNSLFVQLVKSKDEIIKEIKSSNNESKSNQDDYQIYKIFVLDNDEKNLKNIENYFSNFGYTFSYTNSEDLIDKDYFFSTNKNNPVAYKIGTMIVHDSEGINFYSSTELDKFINKIN